MTNFHQNTPMKSLQKQWDSLPLFLEHHTVTSAHTRKSPRTEIIPDLGLEEHVLELLSDISSIPNFPGAFARGQALGSTLKVDVLMKGWAVVTFLVAPDNSTVSASAFAKLVKRDVSKTGNVEPRAPYCSVALSIEAISMISQLSWIADYERCIAWTWLAMISEDPNLTGIIT